MQVELIDSMGSDLTVVNAARVSYGKHVEGMSDKDYKLLNYLAKHKHWTPFAHPQLSFRIKASISVARQLFRHQVGLAVNEVSRRYVKDEPEFDIPEFDEWRRAPGKGQSKQGSGESVSLNTGVDATLAVADVARHAMTVYDDLLNDGIAPEQARLVLPMALTTEWIWTGSLYSFIRICKERLAPDAQKETRLVATEIYNSLKTLFPGSVKAWGLERIS